MEQFYNPPKNWLGKKGRENILGRSRARPPIFCSVKAAQTCAKKSLGISCPILLLNRNACKKMLILEILMVITITVNIINAYLLFLAVFLLAKITFSRPPTWSSSIRYNIFMDTKNLHDSTKTDYGRLKMWVWGKILITLSGLSCLELTWLMLVSPELILWWSLKQLNSKVACLWWLNCSAWTLIGAFFTCKMLPVMASGGEGLAFRNNWGNLTLLTGQKSYPVNCPFLKGGLLHLTEREELSPFNPAQCLN